MAQTNYTPISLYYSTTASAVPTAANLVPGELAINTADGKLYYEDSSGVVQVLATKSTGSIGGSNTQVQFNNSGSLGGSSGLTWDGSFLTTSSIKNSALTSGRVTYAGASGLLTDSAGLTYNSGNLFTFSHSSDAFLYVTSTGNAGANISLRGGGANASYGSINNYRTDNSTQNWQIGGVVDQLVLPFFWGTTEGMRLNSTGLGVGNTNPSYKLDVDSGSASSSGVVTTLRLKHPGTSAGDGPRLLFTSGTSTTGGCAIAGYGTALNEAAMLFYSGGNTERMRLDSSGNLGLGVTPSAWAGTGVKAFQFQNGSLAASNTFATNLAWNAIYDGSYKYVSNSTAGLYQLGGSHSWSVAPSGTAGGTISFTQAMTLDASGNLLVGTTSVPTTARTKGFAAKPSSSGGISIYQTDNVSDWGITATSGSIVNFYSDTGSALTYAGTISVNGIVTTYGSVSDYRLKENIAPMTGALAKVAQLKPVTYKWKLNGSDGQGFIAHELAEVVPDCVTGEKDAIDEDGKPKYQAMDTSHLVATLVSAIQELKAEVDSLKQQLNGA